MRIAGHCLLVPRLLLNLSDENEIGNIADFQLCVIPIILLDTNCAPIRAVERRPTRACQATRMSHRSGCLLSPPKALSGTSAIWALINITVL
jgi:hypothetical protein